MAMRKGKSRHRISDWTQRGGGPRDEADFTRESLIRRAVKLPADRLEAPQENLEDLPKAEGMVMGFFPGGAVVRHEGQPLLCGIAKTFRAPEGSSPLAVGDQVTVALTWRAAAGDTKLDKDRADGMILARQVRRTALVRPQPRSGKRRGRYDEPPFEKVIVANMDVLLIVMSSRQPPLHQALVDRLLIVAQRGNLEPILVVNKLDLDRPDEALLAELAELGLTVLLCSALTGEGVAALRSALSGRRSVLAGPSGTGKSTLVNLLVPGANAPTRQVRLRDQRGRHTTSSARLYDLEGGGTLVDTPGIREVGVQIRPTELPWYFPEFDAPASQCRFRNCTHTREPGCAVQAAVEAGTIQPRRYQSYLRLLSDLEENRA
jgi:ribosome biogenesis GTPase